MEQLIKERGQVNFVDLYYATMELNEKYGYLPLDEAIDLTIQKCPVDYRRRLYSNIVILDATSIQNLDRRIELCLQKRIDQRLKKYNSGKPGRFKVNLTNFIEPENVVCLEVLYSQIMIILKVQFILEKNILKEGFLA